MIAAARHLRRRGPRSPLPARNRVGPWAGVAMLLCVAVIVTDCVTCPVGLRAPVSLLFAVWVPGASVLWLVDPRQRRRPSVPALGVSLSILILASGIPVEFDAYPARAGFVGLAAGSWLIVAFTVLISPRRRSPVR